MGEQLYRRLDIPTHEDWEWEDHPDAILVEGPEPFMLVPVEPEDTLVVPPSDSPAFVDMRRLEPGRYAIVRLDDESKPVKWSDLPEEDRLVGRDIVGPPPKRTRLIDKDDPKRIVSADE